MTNYFRLFTIVILILFLATSTYSQNNFDASIENLVSQIIKNMDEAGKTKIAVIEFSDLNGITTDLGKYLAEELITKLFLTKKFNVIERQLLNKVINENKLSFSGLIDPNSAKKLGMILGVESIVSGSIADLGETIKVNARLISTETGEIFAVAAVNIIKNNTIKSLLGIKISGNDRKIRTSVSGDIFFKEDFSNYDEGDLANDWGNNLIVRIGDGGEKYVQNNADKINLSNDINFPMNFEFSYQYYAKYSHRPDHKLILEDRNGEQLVLEIRDAFGLSFSLNGVRSNSLRDEHRRRNWHTVKLVVKNNTFKTYINDNFVVSGFYQHYANFVRIKLIQTTIARDTPIYFKNILGRQIF